MSKRSGQPSDEDRALFRDAIGDVRPVAKKQPRSDQRSAPPPPEPVQFQRDEARVIDELLHAPIDALAVEVGEELSYIRADHDPRLLRRLKRGQFAVQDEIDLHHMNLTAARDSVKVFLADATRQGYRCVRIIHGKGLRSRTGPVLKALVDRMLRQRNDVLAFASARAQEGGTGAVLVLLRRRPDG